MSQKSAPTGAARRPLDRIDRSLLGRLQQDGRAAVSQLAREVHLTVTPTLERVRRLESAGYIEGYFARLNPGRLGLGLLAYVEVLLDRTTPDAFERFKQVMLAHDEVMECHMVAGGFDYLLKVRVIDMESYRRFLGDRIASVRGLRIAASRSSVFSIRCNCGYFRPSKYAIRTVLYRSRFFTSNSTGCLLSF